MSGLDDLRQIMPIGFFEVCASSNSIEKSWKVEMVGEEYGSLLMNGSKIEHCYCQLKIYKGFEQSKNDMKKFNVRFDGSCHNRLIWDDCFFVPRQFKFNSRILFLTNDLPAEVLSIHVSGTQKFR